MKYKTRTAQQGADLYCTGPPRSILSAEPLDSLELYADKVLRGGKPLAEHLGLKPGELEKIMDVYSRR